MDFLKAPADPGQGAMKGEITNCPKRILQNIGWNIGGRALETGIGFLIGIAVVRYLGPASFGGLTMAIIITGLFQRMAIGGTLLPTARRIAQAKDEQERWEWEGAAREIVRQRSLWWTAIGLGGTLLLPKELGWSVAIGMLAIPFNTGECRAQHLNTTLKSKKTIPANRLAQIAGGLTQIGLLATGAPGWLFTLGIPVTEWTRTFWLTRGIQYGKSSEERKRELKRESDNMRIPVVVKYLTATLPTLILGTISKNAAGFFSCARKMNMTCLSFTNLYSQSILPKVMNTQDWYAQWKILTITGIVMGGTLWMTAPWLIPTLYGQEFQQAIGASQWLALALVPTTGAATLEGALLSKNKSKGLWKVSALATGIGLATAGIAFLYGLAAWEITAIFTTTANWISSTGLLWMLTKK